MATQTEKITLNVTPIDLAAIDLLVEQGFYQNRTDFFKHAIAGKLQEQQSTIDELVTREVKQPHSYYTIGIQVISCKWLADLQVKRDTATVVVYGLLTIDQDVPLSMLQETVTSIKVYGVTHADKSIKAAYGL
ncbi:hypothetical protein [Lacticaseibacillus mingshuiensis]|uniref:CopG family transcriptional regulator n=1 Tax=Lacticaseibacillus mingshuiensis TaxID=2799574 RepID=A0ABW4CM66_9LACO|nr:hypothetical protein [Lacticaseibacillus mingshuiensis]